jgi:hypothetical protein
LVIVSQTCFYFYMFTRFYMFLLLSAVKTSTADSSFKNPAT